VEHRVGGPPLHHDQDRHQREESNQEGPHVRAGDAGGHVEKVQVPQPVEQRQDHGDQHQAAERVDRRRDLPGVTGQHEAAHHEDGHGDRDVDVEDPLPVLRSCDLQDQAARRGAEDVGDAVHRAHETEGEAAALRGHGGADFRRRNRKDAAAADRLQCPRRDEHAEAADVLRQATQQRPEAEQPDGEQVDPLAAVPVGQFAHDGDRGGVGQRVDRDHPDAADSSTPS
jgi:hypothetical protein